MPTAWQAQQLAPLGHVDHYVLKPSDGPKPAEMHIHFSQLNVAAAAAYLAGLGYQQQAALLWAKPGTEVVLAPSGSCPVACGATLVVLESP